MKSKNLIQSSKCKDIEANIKELEAMLKLERAKQTFVEFVSPGTFFNESSKQLIEDPKDIVTICKKAKKIKERYNASPYGFRIVDGNDKSLSGFYFITGDLIDYDHIEESDKNSCVRANMRCNGYAYVVVNTNSYKTTNNFDKNDCVVDWDGDIIIQGDSLKLMEYRKTFALRCARYYAKDNMSDKEF